MQIERLEYSEPAEYGAPTKHHAPFAGYASTESHDTRVIDVSAAFPALSGDWLQAWYQYLPKREICQRTDARVPTELRSRFDAWRVLYAIKRIEIWSAPKQGRETLAVAVVEDDAEKEHFFALARWGVTLSSLDSMIHDLEAKRSRGQKVRTSVWGVLLAVIALGIVAGLASDEYRLTETLFNGIFWAIIFWITYRAMVIDPPQPHIKRLQAGHHDERQDEQ